MKRLSNWYAIFAPGGWVRAKENASGTTVYMHLRASGEGPNQRLNVHTVVMGSDKPISTHVWRYVPFGAVEEVANLRGSLFHNALMEQATEKLLRLKDLEGYFEEPERTENPPGGGAQPRLYLDVDNSKEEGFKPDSLARPEGRITDEFLTDLGTMYRWLVASGNTAPATAIAEQTGAPVATVRRWIGNARERGFLPPGRPGRAG
ncbi:hypothetical protein ACFWBR_35010 [Streptomyces sp. NPDC060006]|uniref:hypothetical protein n=1 Tax=unclassified Streptomyces TaxID=2593676 RepID=UPI003676784D